MAVDAGDLPRPTETREQQSLRFNATLTKIQSRPLAPENIDSYADDALTDLIKLTTSVTGEYDRRQFPSLATGKELEDSAFSYFGLSNIEGILNHVASKATEISGLDQIIEGAENMNVTLVPPETEGRQITEGNGTFESKSVILRTKTLLFILSNDFDVDINDPEQVSLKTGVLLDNMMRKLSYYMINVPKLNRTILCCDEEGNVTYVFDNSVLNNHGVTSEDLVGLTKPGINDLLQADPKLGRRIVYSNQFVPKMIGLITDLDSTDHGPRSETAGLYLYLNPPEGVLSARGLARNLGVADSTMQKVIGNHGDELGEAAMYRFGNRGAKITKGYTLTQQETIRRLLEKQGLFIQQASEGVLSTYGLAEKLGVAYATVSKAITELDNDKLGTMGTYRFGVVLATGFTLAQQELIEQQLENSGNLTKHAPEDIVSPNSLAKKLGISKGSVSNAIKNLGDTLGSSNTYKFGGVSVKGYTPSQQAMIESFLRSKGVLATQASESVLSLFGMASKLGVNHTTLSRVIKAHRQELGTMKMYKFGTRPGIGLTPTQQAIIEQHLRDNGILQQVPEGIVSATELAEKLGVDHIAVRHVMRNHANELGTTQRYKFGTRTARGLTPAQQAIIEQRLRNSNHGE